MCLSKIYAKLLLSTNMRLKLYLAIVMQTIMASSQWWCILWKSSSVNAIKYGSECFFYGRCVKFIWWIRGKYLAVLVYAFRALFELSPFENPLNIVQIFAGGSLRCSGYSIQWEDYYNCYRFSFFYFLLVTYQPRILSNSLSRWRLWFCLSR